MHPEPVAAALSEAAAPDAIFTADTGMCNVWSSRYIRPTKDRRLIGSFTHSSMANALPQSIGAHNSLIPEDRSWQCAETADLP